MKGKLVLVFSFLFALGSACLNGQSTDPLNSPMDSTEMNDLFLSEESYLFLRATVDSILLDAQNFQSEIERDMGLFDEEMALSEDSIAIERLKLKKEVIKLDLLEIRNERREIIDHHLQITGNPDSWEVAKNLNNLLKDRYGIIYELIRAPKPKPTNKQFYFEVEDPSSIDYDDPCALVFNGRDYEINKDRKQTATSPFFQYTNPKLKSYFKEKDFLTCNAAIVKLDKDYLVYLEITIASKDAPRSYGYVERSAVVMFEFINGDRVYGEALRRVSGAVNEEATHTKYDLFIKIDKSSRKQLYKREMNELGIFWSTGFEKYNIYEVDLLMRQLRCIEE